MFKIDFLAKLLPPQKQTNRVSICELCGAKPEIPGQPIGRHTNAQTGEACNGTLILITQQPASEGLARQPSDLHRNRGPFC